MQEAIDDGADFIECDVVVTKDLVLICLHENWLSEVTNVKDVFPGKKVMKHKLAQNPKKNSECNDYLMGLSTRNF